MTAPILPVFAALVLVAACTGPDRKPANQAEVKVAAPAPANAAAEAPLEPPAPGAPGGLPDDRTPVSEAPFAETSPQGAANVVQSYYALLESGRYAAARRLWSDGTEAGGSSDAEYAARFRRYREYHAQIGAPGAAEGAAGSIYVEVPVQVYGRLTYGEPFSRRGTVTLRRANDVPGSTAEQRRWHLYRSEVEPPD